MNGPAAGPRFSIVTAVYDVEPYLPAFIESVERQRVDPAELEVIAVDDGSTDGSLDVLRAWAGRSRYAVHVFTQPNAGQGSARNRGLDHATGEWVTFPDPDDLLDRDYLRTAASFAADHPTLEAMSARPVLHYEDAGSFTFAHPRRWQFSDGNRVASLVAEPNVFLALTPGSFFRLDRIRGLGLRFDTRIRPNFEDAHFAARYILDLPKPEIGLLRDAIYVYRKRAAGTSTLQGSMRHPGRYTDVLELGYLDLIERGRLADGTVLEWIQQLIVYEMSWFLSEDEQVSTTVQLSDDVAPRFHELFDRVLRELEPAVVMTHEVRFLRSHWRDILARSSRGGGWRTPFVVREHRDHAMGLCRVHYRFVGDLPAEEFRTARGSVRAAYAKTMVHRYFGRDLLWERILWLPDRPGLEVDIDGVTVPMLAAWPLLRRPRRRSFGDLAWVVRHEAPARLVQRLVRRARRLTRRFTVHPARIAAASWPWRARFRDAWVVMDRIHDADDNGERLFEHLRAERPDINAWFVLEAGTPDWQRLAAAGEQRVVAHGSLAWKALMANCSWLISSHIDEPIVRPREVAGVRRGRPWRFAFLQHGVIKDDLSRWLNPKQLNLFVVSTAAEHASVAGDGTTYRFTTKETRLTGLPRFDRLLAKGRAIAPEDRDLVIVSPTWRNWLTLPLGTGTQRRELDAAFWDSPYIQSWLGILGSTAIRDAVGRRGWRLGFMPHPNLQSILGELDLPDHVTPLTFAGVDVQALYAACALLVTDYSSVAFNAAYLDRPVVYFQFDREAMLGGAHVGRKGYFEYERDGFGPVVETLDDAEREIVAAIDRGPRPSPEYQARIDTAFPVRDGSACARVVAAIEEMSRPWQPPITASPPGASEARAGGARPAEG